ncbi:beta galactosidase jelly roll domain-containing protein [Chryseobacterium sp. SSA4.19]|uniref:sialate O-acetylesterase n=1 Tax=Chryseobacterium sp. SSA4.19 TaxID=2919915 RepID=UPI001F4DB013|nr:sialate O-acetylesterase [Chryseobacterium sp. SSA4.19]MCJ8155730.1 beta galactosidase jelly roll domain-containing protein [Chryseobacterium sp. SSA4.19]
MKTGYFRPFILFKLTFLMVFFSHQPAFGKIKLPDLVGDKMVLQRDVVLTIWGWADQGENITITFRNETYNTSPDKNGKWSVQLKPQKAGGPFMMEINEITIRDVLVGDVWLASGQSNMETPIARLTDRFPEINVSDLNKIRYFKVPTQNSVESVKENIAPGGKWFTGTASEVMSWTAFAYFYALEAYEHTKIPQGMLVSSLGGSAIQSWISQEHLKDFPNDLIDRQALSALNASKLDKGTKLWNQKDFDDTNWQKAKVPGKWKDNGIQAKGTVWFRKNFDLPASMDGKFARLYLGVMVDSDSVFVNGKFVGSTSYTYPPRKYDIPGGILKQGKNTIAIQLTSNFGNGEFVADKPYKIVGDGVVVDLTGEWKYNIGRDTSKDEDYRSKLKNLRNMPSGLYNGMIYPILDYKVRGAIWYQGESNAGQSENYAALLKNLIENWREVFQWEQMPFLLVQLPNFMEKTNDPNAPSGWAGIRETQFKTSQTVPYTAMSVNYDLGEWNDIHPLNKKDMAKRLFLAARKLVYGEKLVSSGPAFRSMKVENSTVILSFDNVGKGLKSRNGALKHFAIAGSDKKFVWAEAKIKGNTVVVSSKEIKNPVAVRYAWSNNPEEANLENAEGLLASPFKTDDW